MDILKPIPLLLLIVLGITNCTNTNENSKDSMSTNIETEKRSTKMNTNSSSEVLLTMQIVAETTGRYVSGQLEADEFAKELSIYMDKDIVFWSNYSSSNELIKPLFTERKGIDQIIERYKYEAEYEKIKGASAMPTDLVEKDGIVYYSQRETASFGDGEDVTWNMVTKFIFENEKIRRIEMYLDSRPIEEKYGMSENGKN